MTAQPAELLPDAAAIAAALDYPSLVERIAGAFLDPIDCPTRLQVERGIRGEAPATLLIMVAARRGGRSLVKTVTVGTGRGVRSHILLGDPDGRLIIQGDGEAITARRTAAASVRAAAALARPDADSLAILGGGPQAAALADAYVQCRPLKRVTFWARRPERAKALAEATGSIADCEVSVAASAGEAVRCGDIVSAATRSISPLIRAADVRAGAHIDLVGGFRPGMREADDELMRRAVVVADSAAALSEAGDLIQPLAAGVLREADVGLLRDWLRDPPARRRADADVTVFKSVGFAALDLVAAELLLERLEAQAA